MTDFADKPDEKPADKPAAPPWGDDFDAQRAWNSLLAARDTEKTLKARLKEFEDAEQARTDADKSELDKAIARAERAEAATKAAQRDAVLAKSGLDEKLHGFITADDAEGIAAQIAALKDAMGDKGNDGADDAADDTSANGRPKPDLRPGSGGTDPEPFDPAAIAAEIRQG
jgi:hypothetical protein